MISHNETIDRDKSAGPAVVESDRGVHCASQPTVRKLKAIPALQLISWRVVEEPHAFVGLKIHGMYTHKKQGQNGKSPGFDWPGGHDFGTPWLAKSSGYIVEWAAK